jgi:hypothetical protein
MKLFNFLMIIMLILLVGCDKDNTNPSNLEKLSCTSDSDCVAASCCHPDSCVNKDNAPDCMGLICSQECVKGTMDCGKGSCKCTNNKCGAIINE